MSHANAALTPRHRLRLARLVVEENRSVVYAARLFNLSWPTAKRWTDRYAAMGPDGMEGWSSRPHHMPTKTPQDQVRKVVHLRWKKRLEPVAIGAKLDTPPSTVHAVLTRCHLNKLHHVDVRTGWRVARLGTVSPRCWYCRSTLLVCNRVTSSAATSTPPRGH